MKLVSFADQAALVEAAANQIADFLTKEYGVASALMLPGGSTPLPAYQAVTQAAPAATANAWLMLSDERVVPPDAPESNFGRIHPMALACGVGDERVLRVDTAHGLAVAAAFYEAALREFLDAGGHIPLGFLGVGTDGHTASLFSMADLDRSAGHLAIPIPKASGPDRVSVTPAVLARVDRIIFLLAGKEKHAICETLLQDPASIPAGRAVAGHAAVEVWAATD